MNPSNPAGAEQPMRAEQLIESYYHEGPGYKPFLIREGWQVAQLNYLPRLDPPEIRRVERHMATDEVFILFQGKSILIVAQETANGMRFAAQLMKPGVTYNIPAGMWHSITMMPGDIVIIVEKSNTHLNDVTYHNLGAEEYTAFQASIAKVAR